eukprot:scaffold237164_cov48-Attheya_sp.AAC.1
MIAASAQDLEVNPSLALKVAVFGDAMVGKAKIIDEICGKGRRARYQIRGEQSVLTSSIV